MRTFNLGSQVWRAVAVVGFAWLAADSAAAQDCARDADCNDGFVCHSEEYENCVRVCNGDDNCQPRTCETSKYAYCVNAPCGADADCPSSMRCYAPTYVTCSGSMGGAGGAMWSGAGGMGVPATDECHEEQGDATCVARYALPCEVAADCGPGFACEEQTYSVCSGGPYGGAGGSWSYGGAGGSGVPIAGFGGAGGLPDSECHEESTGTSACRLLEVACESNSDCDDGLECQANPNYWPCGSGVGAGGAPAMMSGAGGATPAIAGAGGAASSDGCTPSASPSQICAPPNYYGYGGMYPGSYAGAGGATGGYYGAGAGGTTGAAGSTNSNPDADASPGNGNGGTTASSGAGGAGNGHAGNGHSGNADPSISNSGTHVDGIADDEPEQAGCSVSGNDAGAQLSNWAALIGLVAFGLRRRARAERNASGA